MAMIVVPVKTHPLPKTHIVGKYPRQTVRQQREV